MRIALTYNLKPMAFQPPMREDYYAEWDDRQTVDAVAEALGRAHTVVEIAADENIVEKFKGARPDIVFNLAEGINSPSRESQVPVICEMLGIPYTGSDGFTLAACLNKARAKEIMCFHRVPTPPFETVNSLDQEVNWSKFPVIVKPLWEGSSMGVRNDSLVSDRVELRSRLQRILADYHQPALVETYLSGREFTIALLGNGKNLRVLPIVEINFQNLPPGANHIYSYEAKWVWDRPEKPLKIFSCPATLEGSVRNEIEDVCTRAYHALGCRDWCRIDVRMDDMMKPCVLELNPLPGVLPDPDDNSCFPKAARAAGMSYGDLIREVFHIACARYGINGA